MSKHTVMEETPIHDALDAEYRRRERGRIIQAATDKAIAGANAKEVLLAFHYGAGVKKFPDYSVSPKPEPAPTKRKWYDKVKGVFNA